MNLLSSLMKVSSKSKKRKKISKKKRELNSSKLSDSRKKDDVKAARSSGSNCKMKVKLPIMLIESKTTDCLVTSSVTLNYGIFLLSNLTPTILKKMEGQTIKTQVKKQECNLLNQLEITKMKKKRFTNMTKVVSNRTNSRNCTRKRSKN